MSKQVRADLRTAVADRRRRDNTARAHDQADREQIVAARLDDDRQKRVSLAIIRKLKRTGRATRRELRIACTRAIRYDFDPVFEMLVDKEFLVCQPGGDGRADEYKLAADFSA